MVSGEKRSLKVLLAMCELALKLFDCSSIAAAKEEYESLKEKPVYARYIEESVLFLNW